MSTSYRDKRVLIVDDTAFMRAGILRIMQEMGFNKLNLVQAENGQVAYELLSESQKDASVQFDLILCDWNMPSMNGLELLKLVRASNSYYKKIPFVMVTTNSEKDKVIEAIQYQVTGYLMKPVQQPKLKETVTKIFSA